MKPTQKIENSDSCDGDDYEDITVTAIKIVHICISGSVINPLINHRKS